MDLSPQLISSVKVHEGLRLKTYLCSAGVRTIGYGTNLDELLPASYANTLEITEECAAEWLLLALRGSCADVKGLPAYRKLDRVRQDTLVEMAYNLGIVRLARFKKMLAALAVGDWDEAEAQALDSRWAKQVGNRAVRLAYQLRSGRYWND